MKYLLGLLVLSSLACTKTPCRLAYESIKFQDSKYIKRGFYEGCFVEISDKNGFEIIGTVTCFKNGITTRTTPAFVKVDDVLDQCKY